MSEHERIHQLLKASLSAPAPRLSPGFASKLNRKLKPAKLTTASRRLLVAYTLIAVLLSVWVMRLAEIDWPVAAAAVITPLLLTAAVQFAMSWVRLSSRTGR